MVAEAGVLTAVQCTPPSTVRSTEPVVVPRRSPTTSPCWLSRKLTAVSRSVLNDVCLDQVRPPLPEVKMVPLSPTAQPRLASTKSTPSSRSLVPEVRFCQLDPPLLVERMTPSRPTAQAVEVLIASMPVRSLLVPEFWLAQWAPPSTVLSMVPEAPTAQPTLVVTNLTLLRYELVPVGRTVSAAAWPANVATMARVVNPARRATAAAARRPLARVRESAPAMTAEPSTTAEPAAPHAREREDEDVPAGTAEPSTPAMRLLMLPPGPLPVWCGLRARSRFRDAHVRARPGGRAARPSATTVAFRCAGKEKAVERAWFVRDSRSRRKAQPRTQA